MDSKRFDGWSMGVAGLTLGYKPRYLSVRASGPGVYGVSGLGVRS